MPPPCRRRCSATAHLIIGGVLRVYTTLNPPSLPPRCSLTVAPHPRREHNNCTRALLRPLRAAPKPWRCRPCRANYHNNTLTVFPALECHIPRDGQARAANAPVPRSPPALRCERAPHSPVTPRPYVNLPARVRANQGGATAALPLHLHCALLLPLHRLACVHSSRPLQAHPGPLPGPHFLTTLEAAAQPCAGAAPARCAMTPEQKP